MKVSGCIVALLLCVFAVSLAGCGPTVKPPTEEQKKQADEEMRKAIEKNKQSD